MSPASVFITGCNRGIGLELVKQFLMQPQPPKHLFATCRNPDKAPELMALTKESQNLHVVTLEVTDHSQYPRVVDQVNEIVGNDGLNLLINNAGVLPQNRELDTVTADDMRQAFEVNCLAPLFLTKAFLPLLKKAAQKVGGDKMSVNRAAAIQMSTAVASINENSGGKSYAYRTSKTALNMVMKNLSHDLKDDGILVMSMHPGWVLTEMGGPNAMIDTTTCASTMIQTLDALEDKDHGAFLRYNNTPITW